MLLERCRQLQQDIARLSQLRDARDHAQAYQAQRTVLVNAVRELEPLCDILELFRSKRIPVETPDSLAYNLSTEVSRIREQFRRDPSSIRSPGAADRIVLQRIPQLAARLRPALVQAWAEYTERDWPQEHNPILDVLGRIGAFSAQVEQIRNIQQEIAVRRPRLPASAAEIELFDDLDRRLGIQWTSLRGDGVPEDVLRFLNRAVSDGAPLDLLTQEVRDWLGQKGILDSFRVRVHNA